jgi:hypothetical protein
MPPAEAVENTVTPRRLAVKPAAGCPYRTNLQHAPRSDKLTAQRVEVGMIFLDMLGAADAAEYMLANAVPPAVVARVLAYPQRRRSGAASA